MNKLLLVGIVLAPLVFSLVWFVAEYPEFVDSQTVKNTTVFHVILADLALYDESGRYRETVFLEEGIYEFRFVPNGDSPETLTITLLGEYFSFSEDFDLKGTPHQTDISLYYTWDYEGPKKIQIFEDQQILIEIDPNGNLVGPVSLELIPIK